MKTYENTFSPKFYTLCFQKSCSGPDWNLCYLILAPWASCLIHQGLRLLWWWIFLACKCDNKFQKLLFSEYFITESFHYLTLKRQHNATLKSSLKKFNSTYFKLCNSQQMEMLPNWIWQHLKSIKILTIWVLHNKKQRKKNKLHLLKQAWLQNMKINIYIASSHLHQSSHHVSSRLIRIRAFESKGVVSI